MTPNEDKILKYLWDAKGQARLQVISQNVGLGADYTRLLCGSLARAGYLTLADASTCCLLAKGRYCFQGHDELRAGTEIKKEVKKILKQQKRAVPSLLPTTSAVGLDALKDATYKEKEKLIAAGYKIVADVAETPVNRFIQNIGISLKKAAHWINRE